jgi:hypothetical protein
MLVMVVAALRMAGLAAGAWRRSRPCKCRRYTGFEGVRQGGWTRRVAEC